MGEGSAPEGERNAHVWLAGVEGVRYEPGHEEEMKALRREILDHAHAETDAREAREKAAAEKKELERMRKFRDYRLGK
ncbi:MAG: hypothetical protein KDE08_08370 [Rhodobacteraceae bacterium]|nr:hypothetical protein [Paracoccaceae bacterium]